MSGRGWRLVPFPPHWFLTFNAPRRQVFQIMTPRHTSRQSSCVLPFLLATSTRAPAPYLEVAGQIGGEHVVLGDVQRKEEAFGSRCQQRRRQHGRLDIWKECVGGDGHELKYEHKSTRLQQTTYHHQQPPPLESSCSCCSCLVAVFGRPRHFPQVASGLGASLSPTLLWRVFWVWEGTDREKAARVTWSEEEKVCQGQNVSG